MVKLTKIQLQNPTSASATCNLFDGTYTGLPPLDHLHCHFLVIEVLSGTNRLFRGHTGGQGDGEASRGHIGSQGDTQDVCGHTGAQGDE